MARYKEYNYSQGKFIPVFFEKQTLPGTFEHSLHYLIDQEIDLSIFEGRYNNDETGARIQREKSYEEMYDFENGLFLQPRWVDH
jgi:hypothetical protein